MTKVPWVQHLQWGDALVLSLSDPVVLELCERAWLIECQNLLWQTKDSELLTLGYIGFGLWHLFKVFVVFIFA